MVEDHGFEGIAAATATDLFLQVLVLLSDLGRLEFDEIAVGINGVSGQRTFYLLGDFLQLFGGLVLIGQRAAIQFFRYGIWQVLRDKPLDYVPLVIHDAVDAEVQVGAVELEQFAQKALKFLQRLIHQLLSPVPWKVTRGLTKLTWKWSKWGESG